MADEQIQLADHEVEYLRKYYCGPNSEAADQVTTFVTPGELPMVVNVLSHGCGIARFADKTHIGPKKEKGFFVEGSQYVLVNGRNLVAKGHHGLGEEGSVGVVTEECCVPDVLINDLRFSQEARKKPDTTTRQPRAEETDETLRAAGKKLFAEKTMGYYTGCRDSKDTNPYAPSCRWEHCTNNCIGERSWYTPIIAASGANEGLQWVRLMAGNKGLMCSANQPSDWGDNALGRLIGQLIENGVLPPDTNCEAACKEALGGDTTATVPEHCSPRFSEQSGGASGSSSGGSGSGS
jgi:hypothetical protein